MTVFFTSAEDIVGAWILATGWIGVIFFQLSWYANPINLLALLLAQENPRIALLLSLLALVIASGAFMISEIPIGINSEKIFIKEFGLGFYVWYMAQAFFFLGLFSRFIDSLKR